MSYLITYDLVGTSETSEDYRCLIDAIKGLGTWAKPQKSVFVVATTRFADAPAVRDHLRRYVDDDDRLAVFGLTGGAGWTTTICTSDGLKSALRG